MLCGSSYLLCRKSKAVNGMTKMIEPYYTIALAGCLAGKTLKCVRKTDNYLRSLTGNP